MRQLWPICTRLSSLLPRANGRDGELGAVDATVGPDFDVVAQLDVAEVGHLDDPGHVAAEIRAVAKAVRPDHDARLEHAAVAHHAPFPHRHARPEHAVGPEARPVHQRHVGVQHAPVAEQSRRPAPRSTARR